MDKKVQSLPFYLISAIGNAYMIHRKTR
jgi:hypothetical protein